MALLRTTLPLALATLVPCMVAGCGEGSPPSLDQGLALTGLEDRTQEQNVPAAGYLSPRDRLPLGVRQWVRDLQGIACFIDSDRELRWLQGLAREVEHYPLTSCLACGGGLRPDVHEDPLTTIVARPQRSRIVRVCSEACLEEARAYLVEVEQSGVRDRLDEAAIEAQMPDYPTDLCPLHRVPIDSRGGPHDRVVQGRLVRFCCKRGGRTFQEEAEENFAWIDALRE